LADFIIKKFGELSPRLLYSILKLRQDVFIIEQNCIYDDIDGVDPNCDHLCLLENKELIGYARLVPADNLFTDPSIGRIIVPADKRGHGYGRMVIREALSILHSRGAKNIVIEAQNHLRNYYESEGFIAEGEIYDVDGIPHIKMWQKRSQSW